MSMYNIGSKDVYIIGSRMSTVSVPYVMSTALVRRMSTALVRRMSICSSGSRMSAELVLQCIQHLFQDVYNIVFQNVYSIDSTSVVLMPA
jgi:hypothetical protein